LGWLDPNFVLGVILVVFVLLIPRGLQPLIAAVGERAVGGLALLGVWPRNWSKP
jgi:hypothetical protein